MLDRSDAIVVTMRPARGPRRRLAWEPQSDGRWTFTEREDTGCKWRLVGTEIVEHVAIEDGREVLTR